jgi:hypothetical protein
MAWEQLTGIMRVARDEAEYDRRRVPSACPNDGEPLQAGPGGVLHCISDGWQYPRDWSEGCL